MLDSCTLASAAQAGAAVQVWFRRPNLLEAIRRWRELTGQGLQVGLWEVEWTSKLPGDFSVCRWLTPKACLEKGAIASRFWVVGQEVPKGCKVLARKLGPEE